MDRFGDIAINTNQIILDRFGSIRATNTISATTFTGGSVNLSGNLSAKGNSNTVGSIFTTGGNIGISTTSPAYALDIFNTGVSWTKLRVNGGCNLESSSGTIISISPFNGSFGSIEAFTTGNTAKLPLCLNAYGGNVGIGTTSPNYRLDVKSTSDFALRLQSTSVDGSVIRFENTASGGRTFNVGSTATGSGAGVGYSIYDTAGGSRLLIDANGNVGMGTILPGARLDVSGTGAFRQIGDYNRILTIQGRNVGVSGTADATMHEMIHFRREFTGGIQNGISAAIAIGSRNANVTSPTSMILRVANYQGGGNNWGMDAADIMTLVGDGSVGIGSTTPSARLHVHATDFPNILLTTDNAYVNSIDLDSSAKTGGKRWRVMSTHQSAGEGQGKFCIQNVTESTYPFTINSSGNVGINTLNPLGRFHLSNGNTDNNIIFEPGCTSDGANAGWAAINFNGYFNNGETRINTNKNRWRILVDQRSTVDNLCIDTYNGSSLSTILTLRTNGRVGINELDPGYPLSVVTGVQTGNIASYAGWYGLYPWQNQTADYLTSIYSQYFVISGYGFASFSDNRIKKNVVDVNDLSALEVIRQIEPKQYSYVDEVRKGTEPVWGFIAQQVKGVLDYATSTITEFIPNVYDRANVSKTSDNTILITLQSKTLDLDITDNSTGKIRLYSFNQDNTDGNNDKEIRVTIKDIISENSFTIQETDVLQNVTECFVWGQEVKDFNVLNKDAIFTVSVAALQEVDRELQATKTELQATKTELQTTKSELQTTNDKLLQIKQQLETLMSRVTSLENK